MTDLGKGRQKSSVVHWYHECYIYRCRTAYSSKVTVSRTENSSEMGALSYAKNLLLRKYVFSLDNNFITRFLLTRFNENSFYAGHVQS